MSNPLAPAFDAGKQRLQRSNRGLLSTQTELKQIGKLHAGAACSTACHFVRRSPAPTSQPRPRFVMLAASTQGLDRSKRRRSLAAIACAGMCRARFCCTTRSLRASVADPAPAPDPTPTPIPAAPLLLFVVPSVLLLIFSCPDIAPTSPATRSQNSAISTSFSDSPRGRCVVHSMLTSLYRLCHDGWCRCFWHSAATRFMKLQAALKVLKR